jgi:putative glutamine amidotransferase
MASRPRIGIPLGLDDAGRWRRGRSYQYADSAYADAIERAGGTPLYLPILQDTLRLASLCDGLLFPGGDDLPPPAGYPAGASFTLVPERQIRFDRALLRAALARETPVLGICYGMQLLALESDGALIYDLATECPASAPHRLPDGERHAVRIEPDTRLAALAGSAELLVNSRHHQAVSRAGRGMRVCARSADGVIEAIEATGSGYRLGVQWHPESLPCSSSEALFRSLVEASRAG